MDIKEEGIAWEQPVEGYRYKIVSPEGTSPTGDAAELIYITANDALAEVRSFLLAHGLAAEDRIVHLNQFYPNGRGLDEATSENMRQGVGGAVLKYLEAKAVEQGARAMYVYTVKISMQNFLSKNGFENPGFKNSYVKIFGEEPAASAS